MNALPTMSEVSNVPVGMFDPSSPPSLVSMNVWQFSREIHFLIIFGNIITRGCCALDTCLRSGVAAAQSRKLNQMGTFKIPPGFLCPFTRNSLKYDTHVLNRFQIAPTCIPDLFVFVKYHTFLHGF